MADRFDSSRLEGPVKRGPADAVPISMDLGHGRQRLIFVAGMGWLLVLRPKMGIPQTIAPVGHPGWAWPVP